MTAPSYSRTQPLPAGEVYDFILYVAGSSPNSARAKLNLERLCRTYLIDRHKVVIRDVLIDPLSALADGVVATPTLVKRKPGAVQFILGDLSRTRELLAMLDVPAAAQTPPP